MDLFNKVSYFRMTDFQSSVNEQEKSVALKLFN